MGMDRVRSGLNAFAEEEKQGFKNPTFFKSHVSRLLWLWSQRNEHMNAAQPPHRRIRQPGQPQPATDGLLSFGVGEAAPAAADGGGADRVPLAVLGGLIGLDAAHDPPAGAKGGRGGDACDG